MSLPVGAQTPFHPAAMPAAAYRSPSGSGSGRLLAGAIVLILASMTANPLLTVACCCFIAVSFRLLWRRGEPPILLLVVLFQFAQVSTRVFEADAKGVAIAELSRTAAPSLERAIWLSLGALLIIAIGMRVGAGRRREHAASTIQAEIAGLSSIRVFMTYLVLAALGQVLAFVTWIYLPLSQVFIALAGLKIIPFFILACLVLTHRRGYRMLAIALGLEVVLGFGGYFSEFKTAFFVLIFAASAARVRLSYRQMTAAGAMGAALLSLALLWTAVKSEYRVYLNQGTHSQAVLVPWMDRIRHIGSAVQHAGISDLAAAVQPSIDRLSYVDFFAATLQYVPGSVPHTDGSIWSGAVRHTLMPRLLFPNKPVLTSDSWITRRFTGLQVAGSDEGTSIGIGYVAESYVDFGTTAMWYPLFGLAMVWGWMYRKLLRWARYRVIAYGVAMICLLPAMLFETATAKQLGSGLSRFIVMSIVIVLYEKRLWGWMSTSGRARWPSGTTPRSPGPGGTPALGPLYSPHG